MKSEQKQPLYVEETPVATIDWNRNFEVVEWNSAAESIFGYTRKEAIGHNAAKLVILKNIIFPLFEIWKNVITGKSERHSIIENIAKDGNVILCEWFNTPLLDENNIVTGVTSRVRDITQRAEAENSLKEKTQYLHAVIDNAADGIITINEYGFIESANAAAVALFSYRYEQLLGVNINTLIQNPESSEHSRHSTDEAASNYKYLLDTNPHEITAVRSDGSRFTVNITTGKMEFHNSYKLILIIRDISRQKQIEHDLSFSHNVLRRLTAHLETIREEERTHIAREIHDELGQALMAIKMDVQWMAQHSSDDKKIIEEKVQATLELIDNTVIAVQRISSELRPPMLDDLGLEAATHWYLNQFQERTGIIINTAINLDSDKIIDPDRSITIFRILQESLTNISRHANASNVSIQVEIKGEHIEMNITDNGKGIEEQDINRKTSYGIIGMQERAKAFGGKITIKGEIGNGTTISLLMPYILYTRKDTVTQGY